MIRSEVHRGLVVEREDLVVTDGEVVLRGERGGRGLGPRRPQGSQ